MYIYILTHFVIMFMHFVIKYLFIIEQSNRTHIKLSNKLVI